MLKFVARMFRPSVTPLALLLTVTLSLVLPPATRAAGIPATVADATDLKAVVRDSRIEILPGGYVALLPEPFARPILATDPRYGWQFTRAAFLYAPVTTHSSGGDRTSLSRVVTVHHQPEDITRARQTTRFVARLLRLHRDRFGRDAAFPRGADEAEIWLAPETPPNALEAGGETRDNQIYVFATEAPRSPIEWVRTVAHEWGHLTMNAARGFTLPENDAGGYLGERLYIKWLREDHLTVAVDDGVTRDGLNLYWERQIGPLLQQFAQAGPNSKILTGDGPDAMDLYIGGVLAMDAAFGSTITGRALHSIEGVRPRDFFDAMRRTVSAVTWGAPLPVKLPAWVPLEHGTYTVNKTTILHIPTSTWRFLTAPAQATFRRTPPKREASVK